MQQRLVALKQRYDWRAGQRSLPDVHGWHAALYWRFEALAWLKGGW
jgi:hypothetical protein